MDEVFIVPTSPINAFEYIKTAENWIDILPKEKPPRALTITGLDSYIYAGSVDIRWTNCVADGAESQGSGVVYTISYDINVGYGLKNDDITGCSGNPEFIFKVIWTIEKNISSDKSSNPQTKIRRKVYDFQHLRMCFLPYLCVLNNGLSSENKAIQNYFVSQLKFISIVQ